MSQPVPGLSDRVLGSGIRRRTIAFLPPGNIEIVNTTRGQSDKSGVGERSLAERYLDLVLDKPPSQRNSPQPTVPERHERHDECSVCRLRRSDAKLYDHDRHVLSTAHQSCMSHSRPPFEVDRNRKGAQYLMKYGWSPDHNTGLGPITGGMRKPVVAKVKNNTSGIGLSDSASKRTATKHPAPLDAGRVRKKDQEDREKTRRLQDLFYQRDDVLQHL